MAFENGDEQSKAAHKWITVSKMTGTTNFEKKKGKQSLTHFDTCLFLVLGLILVHILITVEFQIGTLQISDLKCQCCI